MKNLLILMLSCEVAAFTSFSSYHLQHTTSFALERPKRNQRYLNYVKNTMFSKHREISHSRLYDSGGNSPSPESWEREWNLEDNEVSFAYERRERIRLEQANRERFAQGDELFEIRQRVSALKNDLRDAIRAKDGALAHSITQEIATHAKKDADFVYADSNKRLKKAQREHDVEKIAALEQEIQDARSAMPQFNLEGLWVGKYGSHGYEMINVTYVEDTLIAYKVTGDKNVPKGEITFQADLSPNSNEHLDPIELTSKATKQWGMKHLIRFPGKGQVAAEGFRNAQWMEGQLIMVGEYFSFAWVPIGHQIFFGRPSADLTLKMLRENETKPHEANIDRMRDLAKRCMEETIMLEEDCFYGTEGCFE
jgi:hypothetical protein